MTGINGWQAGHELGCSACHFCTTDAFDAPKCIIALELVQMGEAMSANICPQPTHSAHSLGIRRRYAQRVRFDAALASRRSPGQAAAATP